jgi:hypothetical protein
MLIQELAHVAILGAGGMGKTSLATAALHNHQVEAKYSFRYFVPCHSSPTCTELVRTIADHIGVEKGPNLSKKVAHYFTCAPPSLLVLDNLETPWESQLSRHEVEELLSLLTDAPQLGLVVSLIICVRFQVVLNFTLDHFERYGAAWQSQMDQTLPGTSQSTFQCGCSADIRSDCR